MKQGSFDTCRFLEDISNNIEHIFVYNYQELQEHLDSVLNGQSAYVYFILSDTILNSEICFTEASTHIFLDLGDTSESNALTELERIMDNVPAAQKLMKEVQDMEKELRFTSAQFRDGNTF